MRDKPRKSFDIFGRVCRDDNPAPAAHAFHKRFHNPEARTHLSERGQPAASRPKLWKPQQYRITGRNDQTARLMWLYERYESVRRRNAGERSSGGMFPDQNSNRATICPLRGSWGGVAVGLT